MCAANSNLPVEGVDEVQPPPNTLVTNQCERRMACAICAAHVVRHDQCSATDDSSWLKETGLLVWTIIPLPDSRIQPGAYARPLRQRWTM